MLKKTFNALILLIIPLFIMVFTIQTSFALSDYTQKEKDIFKLSNNMGDASFIISDILFNSDKMGEENFKNNVNKLKHILNEEESIIIQIPFASKMKTLSNKLFRDIEITFKDNRYNKKQLLIAQKSFYDYSEFAKKDLRRLYGNKISWLYDMGILTGFTNLSMQSDYENKLLLTNYVHLLEYIPYDIPGSISNAITNIVTTKDIQTTPSQVAMLKEATDIVKDYFSSPDEYIPPVTFKDIVGNWEGRLSDPDGNYHKAKLVISSDLSAKLSVDKMFDNMPISTITFTQSVISFDIKPFNDEKLLIRFAGRMSDGMITGEAVDITGKKGLWQFLKTDLGIIESSNYPTGDMNNNINKLIGTWKGKILEENGAISDFTLYLNLTDDSFMQIENDNYKKDLKLKAMSVNGRAIKFKVEPKGTNLTITFQGKITDKAMEGNINATDGTRGYWRLLKVSNDNKQPDNLLNFNYNLNLKGISELCDPIIDGNEEYISLVSHEKESNPNSYTQKYIGKITFTDGEVAKISLNIGPLNSNLVLTLPETNTNMNLNLTDLQIDENTIRFKTSLDGSNKTEVEFVGTITGKNVSGEAINSIGEKIKWEAVKNVENQTINNTKTAKIKSKLTGDWTGKANVDKDNSLPVSVNFQENKGIIRIGTNDFLFPDFSVENRNVAFTAIKQFPKKQTLIFNGKMNVANSLVGTLSTPEGLIVRIQLEKAVKPLLTSKSEPKKSTTGKSLAPEGISDEEMYNKQSLEASKKMLKSKLEESEKKASQSNQTNQKEEAAKSAEEAKSTAITEPLQSKSEPSEIKEEKSEPIKIASAETKSALTIEKLLGKWTGELTNPENDKSEIIIEFKKGTSFIYVDKEGEKIPFQIFDFNLNGNEISFFLKASPEQDYGIKFKGNLIQGILSGQAIDPKGESGSWFAKKI